MSVRSFENVGKSRPNGLPSATEGSASRPTTSRRLETGGGRGRQIALHTVEGVPDAEIATYPFTTDDMLGLSAQRFQRGACDDVVLIIHGLTTSTDMFIMPEHYNLVRYLLDHDFRDVWSVDFRMSNRHPYNLAHHRFTFDDIALFDFPATLRELRRHVGDRRIHVICHCLGSVSFLMSLFAGASTGVTSVIANSVGLTPRVPRWSTVKLAFAPFLIEYVLGLPYLNPRWADEPSLTRGRVFSAVTSLFHPECDEPACHMLSLMWGTGWPALYHHDNLHDVTHRRGGDLYGGTGMHYYRHVRKMVLAGNRAVKYAPSDATYAALPDDYLAKAPDVTTPVLFVTGGDNHVFADSNVLCHRRLEALVPGRHRLHVFPGYGHQDVFMGKNCHADVFPTFVAYLNEHRR
jgi:lysosomal acid lipase/cholesteryl ester hydrolase